MKAGSAFVWEISGRLDASWVDAVTIVDNAAVV